MKKGYLLAIIMIIGVAAFSGCIKNPPVRTTNPAMNATIDGTYNFISSTCVPYTIDTQRYDTSTTLVITGNTADQASPYDRIVIAIANYKEVTGTYSIVQGQAGAVYYHSVYTSPAAGGVISITKVTNTSIIGYFSFQTVDNINVTNGTFNVNKP